MQRLIATMELFTSSNPFFPNQESDLRVLFSRPYLNNIAVVAQWKIASCICSGSTLTRHPRADLGDYEEVWELRNRM